ncbi:hypothetical protein PV416_08845 [Streptomyces ipomoeae]|uniref:hypothetical protein n=1 Tax=Streptomyces ipomoeae TaxID=103232 RepID=UPI0029B77F61|nr:hypothetical protein [Streptomyces ipomoeae]MDX2821200.1 hypothetical protein [Streptomyces ipomoeae]MDX2874166.1 hypothetical protein [Streptomyces ipomoeae]
MLPSDPPCPRTRALAFLVAGAWLTARGTKTLPTLRGAARRLLVRPVVRLVDTLAAFDDRVLDRAVEGTARGAAGAGPVGRPAGGAARQRRRGGRGGRRPRTRRWARRPQTGQLHQYLAQAVAAFTGIAVVLVLVR